MCVMRRDALMAKRKCGGAILAQFSSMAVLGIW